MSAVRLTGHGGPDRLEWVTGLPVPVPGPGEVLVRVLAAGVNNTDINTRLGWYSSSVTGATAEGDAAKGDGAKGDGAEDGGWAGALTFPRIQGGDLCGRVLAHGPGVTAPPIGARVTCPINQPEPTAANPLGFVALGSEYDGAFATHCVVPARHLYDVSASPLTDVEIAAMPCAFGTAENLLTRAGVSERQRVLVTGASGGVGLAAVALAALRGAEVTGITAAAKADTVRKAGAVRTLDRDAAMPAGAFDAVIDVVGGPGWAGRIAALRPGGCVAVSGAIAGPMVDTDLRQLYLRDITVHGCTFQPPAVFARLVSLINRGAIRPLISRTFPLSDIALAQAEFLSKRHAGKIVLIPPETAS